MDSILALTFGSLPPSALCRLQNRQGASGLATSSGSLFHLLPPLECNGDCGTADEIFVLGFYSRNLQTAVRDVVDLGMNVGVLVSRWLGAYPGYRVVAFEPDRGHFDPARRNIEPNAWLERSKCIKPLPVRMLAR